MTRLLDANELFAQTLEELMHEMGFSLSRYTRDDIRMTVRIACEEAREVSWADFIQWVRFGDDEKAKTRDIIRTSLSIARMWE